MTEQQTVHAVITNDAGKWAGTLTIGNQEYALDSKDHRALYSEVMARALEVAQREDKTVVAHIEDHTQNVIEVVSITPEGGVKREDTTPLFTDEPVAPEPAAERKGFLVALRQRKAIIVVSAAAVMVALALLAVLGLVIRGAKTTAETQPSVSADPGLMWTMPKDVMPVRAAGPVVVGVKEENLVLLSGSDGSEIPLEKPIQVQDAQKIKVASGAGLTVLDTGDGAGATVVEGKTQRFEGKGSVLDRGPVPVLVGGTPEARKFYVFRSGEPVPVEPPSKGNSLFGGLPDGGSIWAVAGGKITFVPAQGQSQTVTLTPPMAGGSVESWMGVNTDRAVVVWKAGTKRVFALHAVHNDASTQIIAQRELKDGENVYNSSGFVFAGTSPDPSSSVFTAQQNMKLATDGPPCVSGVVLAATTWCPASGGGFTDDEQLFNVPDKPIAAGDGFVLVKAGESFEAFRGPKDSK